MNDNFKIKILNLERRPDRWFNLESNLQKMSLNFERYSAVDGLKINLTEEDGGKWLKIFNIEEGYKHHRLPNLTHEFRTGVIGCSISHIKLWEELANGKNNFYLILEDDIKLNETFEDDFKNLIQKINFNWDLIYLGFNGMNFLRDEIHIFGNLYKFKNKVIRTHGGGTYGYMISKEGAIKILENIKNQGVKVPIDQFMIDQFNNLEAYFVKPSLISSTVFSIFNLDSDIQKGKQKVKIK